MRGILLPVGNAKKLIIDKCEKMNKILIRVVKFEIISWNFVF